MNGNTKCRSIRALIKIQSSVQNLVAVLFELMALYLLLFLSQNLTTLKNGAFIT